MKTEKKTVRLLRCHDDKPAGTEMTVSGKWAAWAVRTGVAEIIKKKTTKKAAAQATEPEKE